MTRNSDSPPKTTYHKNFTERFTGEEVFDDPRFADEEILLEATEYSCNNIKAYQS